jgi:hypothetical protein
VGALTKIFKATADRKTRLHDLKGNVVDRGGLLNMPLAVATGVLTKACGYRPAVPWISYRATRVIGRLAREDWKVLECGSGMSTLWFSKRCSFLHSIENDENWYKKISKMIDKDGFRHVKYELRPSDRYADFSDYEDGFFDFILVDGPVRDACVLNAVPKVKPGGYLYLDNTDQQPDAERTLLDAVARRGGNVTYFTDFVPTVFHATQGMLAQF